MKYERLTEKMLKDDPKRQLMNFKRSKDFLVAIDTDGCVTDNMNGKQMLIFHPHFMEFYGLWAIESYFRETAEFYNLFSKHRGCNRFIAIQLTLKALASRDDVRKKMEEENSWYMGMIQSGEAVSESTVSAWFDLSSSAVWCYEGNYAVQL